MSSARRFRSCPGSRAGLSVLLGLALLISGCVAPPAGPKPERTRLAGGLVTLPGQVIGNHLVIEIRGVRNRPWRFLVDTGSSVTLLSPEFTDQFASDPPDFNEPGIRVRGSNGEITALPGVSMKRLDLGEARFENVSALVYDCADISAHLGVRIDGVLGFPLFHDTVFTLDYPQARLVLTPAGGRTLTPGSILSFDPGTKVPLIPVQLGDRNLLVLIDSGSDGPLNLNPVGLNIPFTAGPRPGATVATLTGDRIQEVGRLGVPLMIGDYLVSEPVVDLTDQLSSLGGGLLKHFSITFDPARGQAIFYRDTTTPIVMPPRRSAGLSFNKSPAYWRVVGVVPGSPADADGVQRGDLIVRINGEPVEQWDLMKFDALVGESDVIQFTFLDGREETTHAIEVFPLVP